MAIKNAAIKIRGIILNGAAMLLNLSMLMLLIGLFILCGALVRFAEGVIRPLAESREETQSAVPASDA